MYLNDIFCMFLMAFLPFLVFNVSEVSTFTGQGAASIRGGGQLFPANILGWANILDLSF